MFNSFVYLSFAIALVNGRSLRRQAAAGSVGVQPYPSTAPADNSFSNGAKLLAAEPPQGAPNDDNGIYGNRDIDIPFGRLYGGNLMFFPESEQNNPSDNTDHWTDAGGTDSATQSACGIPHNAFYNSHVAIHPYFLKYAGLDRYCMQDVCISFWKQDWSSDMMLKVTDICSTDENDPTHCATPGDIKIDRSKAKVWDGKGGSPNSAVPEIQGNSFPEPAVWFFMKCWDDGTMQPAYNHVGNWFSQPPFNSNLQWAQNSQATQAQKNQVSYPGKGFPLYENCAYNPKCTPQNVSDWIPGQEPSWAPIAGGKGYSGVVGSPSNLQATTNSSTGAGTVSGSEMDQSSTSNATTPSLGSPALSTGSSTPATGSSAPGTGSSTSNAGSDTGDDAGDGVDYCDEL